MSLFRQSNYINKKENFAKKNWANYSKGGRGEPRAELFKQKSTRSSQKTKKKLRGKISLETKKEEQRAVSLEKYGSCYLKHCDCCPQNVIKVLSIAMAQRMFGHDFVTSAISGLVKNTKFAPK